MSEDRIVANCSPTMAGLKTGNLFSCPMREVQNITLSLRDLNSRLVPRGARILPVKMQKSGILMYMYRPAKLSRDLSDELAVKILTDRGYPVQNSDRCVKELIKRLNTCEDFPHEIGLFLGYPPEDVQGFIENKAKRAKCVGTWKVYGDVEKAKRRFAAYQKCTRVYCEALKKHNSFDRLIVAVS